jgi:nickel/cobalt transporter (NicO) family protein
VDASLAPRLLLVVSVLVVGVLHTAVPDHWAPIALIARQRGWSRAETARAAFQAGLGHVGTTLAIGLVVWFAGVGFATRFGHLVDMAASAALVLFGGWIAIGAWRELQGGGHGHGVLAGPGHGHGHEHSEFVEHAYGLDEHGHDHAEPGLSDDPLYLPLSGETAVLVRHRHAHRHGRAVHVHWHDHAPGTAHEIALDTDAAPPLHVHRHKTSARTALLLILGSSPMVEGIPVFFAASRYGVGLIAAMAIVLAVSTIATYVALCVLSTAGLQRLRLGSVERYGEVISGAFIALVGVVFWAWPVI